MKNIVEVRGLRLGEGIPKICVSIIGKNNEEIISEAEGLKGLKLDLVEWRVDHYKYVEDLNKVKEILTILRKILKDLPLIFTFRSLKEGGYKEINIDYYTNLNKEIVKSGNVDLIDIELFTGDEAITDIVEFAHNNGVKVIISNHDFDKTPDKEEIINRLYKMQELNADLPKIAVMPKTTSDLLILLCAADEMINKHAKTPIITISMSGLGVISRIAGEIFGSAITFGASKAVSAPGQIEVNELYKALNIIHEYK